MTKRSASGGGGGGLCAFTAGYNCAQGAQENSLFIFSEMLNDEHGGFVMVAAKFLTPSKFLPFG
jgi:hypothetical protein